MDAKVARNLKIQLGAVKRLLKDKKMYEQEYADAAKKAEESGFEPGSSELKRLTDLRDEAEAMVHDSERRLADFKGKLATALKDAESFADDPMVIEAKAILA